MGDYCKKKTNQLKSGIILSYISLGINTLIQLAYIPVMIRLLGQREYGLYTLVGSVVGYLSLFSFGLTGAYLRFAAQCETSRDDTELPRLNAMFFSVFWGMGIMVLLCGMILSQYTSQLFGENLSLAELNKAKILMRILIINISLNFPASIFDSMISAHEQFLFQRAVMLAGIICNPLICLPLLMAGFDSVAVVAVTTVISSIKLLLNIWFCFCKLKIPFMFHGFNFLLFKEIFRFSFFVFLNMIIGQINLSVDKFILGRVAGTAAVAIYGVGSQINALFYSFSDALSSVFSPRINRIAASGERKGAELEFSKIFIRVGRIQFIILALILTGYFIFGKYFITEIYAGAGYVEAYYVALMLMVPAITPLVQNIGIEVQRAQNKHQFRSLVYFFMALVNLFASIPLARWLGPIGAALGTAISLLVANGFIMNIYYQKAIGIDIVAFWKNIGSLSKGLIIPAAFGILIMRYIRFRQALPYCGLMLIYIGIYAFSMWFLGMNEYEKGIVYRVVHKIVNRKPGEML